MAGALLLGLVAVLALAGGLFVWRLSQGPLSLAAALPLVERQLQPADGAFRIALGALVLEWVDGDDGSGRLDIRARRVRALGRDDTPLAEVPEVGIGLSLPALLSGQVRPTRLEILRPRLTVVRAADGSFGFAVAAETDTPAPAAAAPAGAPGSGEDQGQSTSVVQSLLDALQRPPDAGKPLGLMNTLRIGGAELSVIDRESGSVWHARRTDLTLVRGATGLSGQGRMLLDIGGGQTVPLEAGLHHRVGDGTTDATVRFARLMPAALTSLLPAMAPLLGQVAVPLEGSLEVGFDAGFHAQRIGFDLAAGAGTVALPTLRPADYRVAGAVLAGNVQLGQPRLTLDRAELRLDTEAGPVAVTARGSAAGTLAAPHASLGATLDIGGRTARLALSAEPRAAGNGGGGDGGRATLRLDGLEPAVLAPLAPALEPLRAAALPLSGTLTAELDAALTPQTITADLTAAAGRVVSPALYPETLPITAAALTVQADVAGRSLKVERFTVDLGGPAVEATASLRETDGRLLVEATAGLRQVPFADLQRYWPVGVGRNARDWITRNVTAGMADTASLTLSGEGPADDPGGFAPTHLHGTVEARDLTIHYFRPLPPVVGVERVEGVIDGSTFTIKTHGGRLEDVQVGDGQVVIINVGTPREDVSIDMPIRGPARTVLTVLDHPPLGYPARLDLAPARAAGTVEANLHFGFPLFQNLNVEDIDVQVQAKLEEASMRAVALGQDVTDAALALDLTVKAMTVKGQARFAGIPVGVDWTERFEEAARGPRTRIAVKGEAAASELKRFGIDPAPYAEGPVGIDLLYTIEQKGASAAALTLDLARSRLAVAELGWSKPAGTPAKARGKVELSKGKAVRVSGLALEGGGLKAGGSVQLDPASGRFVALRDAVLTVKRTDVRGTVEATKGGGYTISVTGPSLDLQPLRSSEAGPAGSNDPLPPIDLHLALDRVYAGPGPAALQQLGGRVRFDGRGWETVSLSARTQPNGTLKATFAPVGAGRTLLIEASDAGTALAALDLTSRVRGGRLKIEAKSASREVGAPLAGTLEMTDYTLVDAPALARLLNAMSIGGLAELLGSKGITFGRLTGSFRKTGDTLALADVRTSGSALGLTMEGDVDLAKDSAKLRGTIVPVYGLNRIIGQIPILGDALSGGAGQGIFAATWHLEGPLDDPQVSVNPLAVLAPGFLRNLFFLGDGTTAPPANEEPWYQRPN